MVITNVLAMSTDGAIAQSPTERDVDRKTFGFLDKEDREHVIRLLKNADAVISGASSIRASGGAFEVVNEKGVSPKWFVLTENGLPSGLKFFQQRDIDRYLVSSQKLESIPDHLGSVTNISYETQHPAEFIVDQLKDKKCSNVLLFGGSSVNRLFYQKGLVDFLELTICPVIFASNTAVPLVAPDLPEPLKLTLETSHSSGNLVFLKYRVNSA
jgi:riboflavin biosynthesis pyrimidine reductase